MKSTVREKFVFEECIQKSIQPFVNRCIDNDIDLVLYGGAIPDYFLGIEPNDYDFYVGCTYDRFMERVGSFEDIKLEKYGDYIMPTSDVFFFISQDSVKYDLKFIGDKYFGADYLYSNLYKRGIVTINSFLYFVGSRQLVDAYSAARDIKDKTIRLADIQNMPSRESMEKTFVLFFTFLCGKYHDFAVDESQLAFIRKFLYNNDFQMSYFERFTWRIPAALARVFDYSQAGLENIIKYWTAVELLPVFCDGISSRIVRDILSDSKTSNEEKLQKLNKASNGRIANSFRRAIEEMPLDFHKSQKSTIVTMQKVI